MPYGGTADEAVKRRIIDFGKFKFVHILGSVSFSKESIPSYTNVILLPPGLSTSYGDSVWKISPASGPNYARWDLTSDGTTIRLVESKIFVPLAADRTPWFSIDFAYISQ